MLPAVDVVVLMRDDRPLPAPVLHGLRRQQGVQVVLHRVIGTRLPGDASRWQTIARARNQGKRLGRSPWLMFLDDDVELLPGCLAGLLEGLQSRRGYAALAANYLNQPAERNVRGHVSMGATLFRRTVLERIEFRCTSTVCECQCACDDLRQRGWGIAYLPSARAIHHHDRQRRQEASPAPAAVPVVMASPASVPEPRINHDRGGEGPPCVLAAFDRRHIDRFRYQFLKTLRAHGNRELVIVVGYGLYPSEQRTLASLPAIRYVHQPINGVAVPIRRLRDFQEVLHGLPPATPVAYWDAGDVIFQSSLAPLWDLVRAHAAKLLAVREPKGHPGNRAVAGWTLSIRDPAARKYAFDLLSSRPFLNSGFAAGSAAVMLEYFREADRLRHSKELLGTYDWGDQTALNLYCHSVPERWHEIPEGWNYCVHDRYPGEVVIRRDGVLISRQGSPIYAAHGNARSLSRHFPFAHA